MDRIASRLAQELSVRLEQVSAAVELLDGGATVPFIARYRKEATGALDDTQLRQLEERLKYLRELEERRSAILKSIAEQEKLTPELEKALFEADTKVRLEDLYEPYKPKRRTKAQAAREAGLEPLARLLLSKPETRPEEAAQEFVDPEKGVADIPAALEGARQILMEDFAENAELIGFLREYIWNSARLQYRVITGKEEEGAKFRDYFDGSEPLKSVPSHRALALFRGRREGILKLDLTPGPAGEDGVDGTARCESAIASHFGIQSQGRPADEWLLETVGWAWKVKIFTRLQTELENQLREAAEREAIQVFARNLRDLLMAAPAGAKATIGLDPGYRTGVKVAVLDETGKLLDTATVYPHQPQNRQDEALQTLAELARRHGAQLVAIGNGTASRETDRLVEALQRRNSELKLTRLVVSESGASVYSASKLAAEEFPELDVSLRGAVSIGRRLQDPLAELVKINPKSIGVGQYQHDVNQAQLSRTLDTVVEDCVNAVGVNVNTASAPLLTRVSGLSAGLAANIVAFRDENGPFRDRADLMKVRRMGDKAFELSAGFLRIPGGDNPLDASAVHPEAYPVVQRIMEATGRSIQALIGDSSFLKTLTPSRFTDHRFGEPTVQDIIAELDKPGRDPRPEFRTASFQEGIEDLKDLSPGMSLEGVVSNVTNFGVFVDIGVHQDGLVHISRLADRFVRDPREVVKAGDIVRVKVVEVDQERRRISLTMKPSEVTGVKPEAAERRERRPPGPSSPAKQQSRPHSRPARPGPQKSGKEKDRRDKESRDKESREQRPQTTMAEAFARMKRER